MEFQQLKQKNKNNQKFRRLTAVIAPSTLPSPPLFGQENARRLRVQIAIAGNNGITIPLAEEIRTPELQANYRISKGFRQISNVISSLKYQSQTRHNHFSAVRQTTSAEKGISDLHKNFGIKTLTNAVSTILETGDLFLDFRII